MNGFFTIGHSNLPIERFISLLQANEVVRLADIRTMPRSHYNPQFNDKALAKSLAGAGIDYIWMRELGGKRQARADSINMGFHPGGFRGYADYMQTTKFGAALGRLMEAGRDVRMAYMCAEGNPQNCHRLLVSDALTARDIEITHILSSGAVEAHRMTSLARVEGTKLFYPPEQPLLL